MKNIIWYLACGGVFLVAYSAPSSAGGREVVVYPATDVYSIDHRYSRHDRDMPRWMSRDRDFRYWYGRNHHREHRNLNWSRLFELYLYEQHYRKYDRHHRKHYSRHDRRGHYDRYDRNDRGRNGEHQRRHRN